MLDIPWKMIAIALCQIVRVRHVNWYLLTHHEGHYVPQYANREDVIESNQGRRLVMGLLRRHRMDYVDSAWVRRRLHHLQLFRLDEFLARMALLKISDILLTKPKNN